MKNIGLKLAGLTVALCLSNLCFAQANANPNQAAGNDQNAAPEKPTVLTPGARVIAGLPGKNDFYILGRNEKMPTELVKADIDAKKTKLAQTVNQKVIATKLPESAFINAAATVNEPSLTTQAATPEDAIAAQPALTGMQIKSAADKADNAAPASAAPAQAQAPKAKAVTSMRKAAHKRLSVNAHHRLHPRASKVTAQKAKPTMHKLAQAKHVQHARHHLAMKKKNVKKIEARLTHKKSAKLFHSSDIEV